jgi:uncharacterized alkaline shock family protein YloU
MEVYALVGKAGTGKSYRAMGVAHEKEIDLVVDDGVLINGTRKLAGKSAKKEQTKISAVKRALFFHEDHRAEAVDSLKAFKPKRVLLLGTSDRMVRKIAASLELPEIKEIIHIEDISTPEEIEAAKFQRMRHGKHVIPLPTLEIKKDFSGYFLDAIMAFVRRRDKEVEIGEKTVMRPTFSYMGNYTVSNKTIMQIAEHATKNIDGFHKMSKFKIQKTQDEISMDIEGVFVLGCKLPKVGYEVQNKVKTAVEHMTGFHVTHVNLVVKNLFLK